MSFKLVSFYICI